MSTQLVELLDHSEEIAKRDREGMLEILGRSRRMMEEALDLAGNFRWEPAGTLSNVVLLGLGGSAIGGDLVKAFVAERLKVPFVVSRHYSAPAFIGRKTLVLVSSYSGNTEETISAFGIAREKGAQIVSITSGGELSRLTSSAQLPSIPLPGGLPPRTALPYSFVTILGVLEAAGLLSGSLEEVRSSLDWITNRLEAYGPSVPAADNSAKSLAVSIWGKIPVVYSSQDRLEYLARRWAGQFSENGKQLAYHSPLPEMNHNEIVGWRHPSEVLEKLVPVFLRDLQDHPRIQIRLDITREILGARVEPILEYWSSGESWLERLWSLILLGDYASIYLAVLNREDPTPVEAIEALKARLRQF